MRSARQNSDGVTDFNWKSLQAEGHHAAAGCDMVELLRLVVPVNQGCGPNGDDRFGQAYPQIPVPMGVHQFSDERPIFGLVSLNAAVSSLHSSVSPGNQRQFTKIFKSIQQDPGQGGGQDRVFRKNTRSCSKGSALSTKSKRLRLIHSSKSLSGAQSLAGSKNLRALGQSLR
jgi:hypothetical protein